MANEVFNVSKGKMMEYHDRVAGNDPANAGLLLVILQTAESDAVLRDYTDLAALIAAAGNVEATFTNYARITLTDTDISASTVDQVNDRREADMPDQTWASAGGAVNNTTAKIILCYVPDTTAQADATTIPIGHFDFVATTDGNDLVAQIDATGYGRST